jgi:Protein of unknown function (DUF3455)
MLRPKSGELVMREPVRSFRHLLFLSAISSLLCVHTYAQNPQTVPRQLQPPSNERLLLQVHAKGEQIYTCKEGSSNQFAWTLRAPEAQLLDKDGKPFGKHFAGPTWQAADGSSITGKAAANATPDPDSIPWLLVTVVSRSGEGVLTKVTSIQRLNTKGGKAPATGCDAAHAGQEVHAAYAADYLFFAPK